MFEPLPGWTDWEALEDPWSLRAKGRVARTPCRGFRILYGVDQDVSETVSHWTIDVVIHSADDSRIYWQCELVIPILILPSLTGPTWSVENERATTSVPGTFQVHGVRHPISGGAWAEQPTLDLLGNVGGDPPVIFDLYSVGYLIPLPSGAIFEVTFHNIGNANLRFARVLTSVLPGGGQRDMMIDPVTSDQHLPRVTAGMLLVRTTLHDGAAGPRDGLALTYADGVATVAPGSAVIGHVSCTATAPLTLTVPAGTQYLYLEPAADGTLALTSAAGPVARPAWCLGMVSGGRLTPCSGVLVATGVTDGTERIGRREDGRLVLRADLDGGEEDVEWVSRDRGVTWDEG